MRIYLAIIASFILCNQNALALSSNFEVTPETSCTSVDFRDSHSIPIRDQRNISWCFAHAAADYLQYTYQIPEQISAADIAINYAKTDLSKFLTFFKRILDPKLKYAPPQTGLILKAVKKALPEGYCPESILPSDQWSRVEVSNGTQRKIDVIDAIGEMYSAHSKISKGLVKNADELGWYPNLRNVDSKIFFELLKNHSRDQILIQLRTQVCNGERKPYNGAISTSFRIRGPRTFERINSSLNASMPVSIDFFSGIFENYDHYKKKVGDLHTVLLYGRKWDTEKHQCAYLMKNSYGTACDQYDPKIKCEAGYLWFPESDLFKAMLSELFIQKK